MSPIRLLVGLGNPGPKYQNTRHNIGATWLVSLANRLEVELKDRTGFFGSWGSVRIGQSNVRFFVPSTFMNQSGVAVRRAVDYYKMLPSEVLIAHDEMAFEIGKSKLKFGGGVNGHNGLANVVTMLSGSKEFGRLRIGVGHPGDPDKVTKFLTKALLSESLTDLALDSCNLSDDVLSFLLVGNWDRAMTEFHRPIPDEGSDLPPIETSG